MIQKFYYLIFAIFIGFNISALAQTDKLPANAKSVQQQSYIVNLTDTVNRQLWLYYGNKKADRIVRYPELLRTLMVDKTYAQHYADSLKNDILNSPHVINGDWTFINPVSVTDMATGSYTQVAPTGIASDHGAFYFTEYGTNFYQNNGNFNFYQPGSTTPYFHIHGVHDTFAQYSYIGDLQVLNAPTQPNDVLRKQDVRPNAQQDSLLNLKQSAIYINAGDYLIGDSLTDNTTAMRALFALAKANGATIYFPKGNYLISDSVQTVYSGKLLGGGGLNPYTGTTGTNTMGIYTGGIVNIIQTDPTKSALVIGHDGTTIDGINLIYKGSVTPTAGAGISILKGNSTRMYNCFVGGFYIGVFAHSLSESTISNNQFANSQKYNFLLNGVIDDEGDNSITSNWFNCSSSSSLIQFKGYYVGGLRLVNNKFHIGVGQGNQPYATGAIDILSSSNTSDLFIQGNSIEGYTSFGLRFRLAMATNTFSSLKVEGNQFASVGNTPVRNIDIQSSTAGNIKGVSVLHNTIHNTGTSIAGIYINGVTYLNIENTHIFSHVDSIVNCIQTNYTSEPKFWTDPVSVLLPVTPNVPKTSSLYPSLLVLPTDTLPLLAAK